MSDTEKFPGSRGVAYPADDGLVHPPENMLRHYAGVLRRRIKWIGFGLVVGLFAGFVSTLFVHQVKVTSHYFKATNTLVVNGSDGGSGSGGSNYSLQSAALLVQSQALLTDVARKMRMSPDQVSRQLSASIRSDAGALDITAISTSPSQAVSLANTAAGLLNSAADQAAQAQYINQVNSLQSQLKALQAQRDSLITQIATQPANSDLLNGQLTAVVNSYSSVYGQLQSMSTATSSFTLTTLQPANAVQINSQGYAYRLSQNINARGQLSTSTQAAPTISETSFGSPTTVSKSQRIILGGFAGFILGVVSAFIVEAWDDRIRRRDRVEALTGLPVLAEIPKFSREQARSHAVVVVDANSGAGAERYRGARTAIMFALEAAGEIPPHPIHPDESSVPSAHKTPVIMVTSPSPGEGKTTTAANLAAACADSGMRTLVIDGDFRRPAISRFLSPAITLVDVGQPSDTRIPDVSFIAAPQGVSTPGEAVAKLRSSIETWRSDFDIVVLDTPPMLTTNDATDLLAVADAVLLVLRAGQTRVGPAQWVTSVLSRFQADVLGIVLNSCDSVDMNPYYAYAYAKTVPAMHEDEYVADQRAARPHEADQTQSSGPGPTNSTSDQVGNEPAASSSDQLADGSTDSARPMSEPVVFGDAARRPR